MSDVYRAEIVLPSTMNNRIVVDMARASRRMMEGEPWIVRNYGYGTADNGDWHDTPAAAWDAAADMLESVAVKFSEAIYRCRSEAAKSREGVVA